MDERFFVTKEIAGDDVTYYVCDRQNPVPEARNNRYYGTEEKAQAVCDSLNFKYGQPLPAQ